MSSSAAELCSQMRRDIPNDKLRLADIPPTDADWDAISDFALTYYCHTDNGSWPQHGADAASNPSASLDELRAWLFSEQRAIRHCGEDPDQAELSLVRMVVERIRERLASDAARHADPSATAGQPSNRGLRTSSAVPARVGCQAVPFSLDGVLEDTVAQQVAQYVNPVLTAIKKLGGSASPAEVSATVVKDMGLEGSPLLEQTNKNGVSKFKNQINWVRFYLATAGYIDQSQHGVWTLTEKGRSAPPLTESDVHQLLLESKRQVKAGGEPEKDSDFDADEAEEEIPEESSYKAQLLEIIRGLPPSGFEQLCRRLLRASGFEQVEVTGRSGDGGIDGIGVLRVNDLVAFKVLFQCKRYSGSVGAPEVRNFRGAMQGRTDKAILLTTGAFSPSATHEAVRDGVPPIELVDGERLVELCAKQNLGLRQTYQVDLGFFEQFKKAGAFSP